MLKDLSAPPPPPKEKPGIMSILRPTAVADRYPKPEIYRDFEDDKRANAAAHLHAVRLKGFCSDTTGTTSMEPLIVGRHFAVNAPIPYEELKEGDIAVYVRTDRFGKPLPGSPMSLHRLVARDKGGWIPSGDNNKRSENWMRVTKDNYKGKTVALYGYKGVENTRKLNAQGQ